MSAGFWVNHSTFSSQSTKKLQFSKGGTFNFETLGVSMLKCEWHSNLLVWAKLEVEILTTTKKHGNLPFYRWENFSPKDINGDFEALTLFQIIKWKKSTFNAIWFAPLSFSRYPRPYVDALQILVSILVYNLYNRLSAHNCNKYLSRVITSINRG